MKIAELFVKLGIESDSNKLKQFDKGLLDAKINAIALTASITALAYGLQKVISASLSSAVSLKNFALQTGLSTQELQKWKYIAEQNDVSGEELITTLQGIQQAQAAIKMGGGNVRPFQLLGISPNENPFTVLEQLKSKIKDLDPALATNIMTQLGVGKNMLNILKGANIEFKELNKQFLLSQNEQKNLLILNKTFKDLFFSLGGLRDKLVALVSPELNRFLKAVKNNFLTFLDIGNGILELKERFSGLFKIIAVIAVGIFAYFSPITALILAIIAIVDDLWVAFHGGDSVIGSIIDWLMKFDIIRGIVKFVSNEFKFLFNLLKFIVDIVPFFIKKFLEINLIKNIINGWTEGFKFLLDILLNIYSIIGKFLGNKLDKIFKFDFEALKSKIITNDAEKNAINNINNSNASNSNTNNINITVNGGDGDGKNIAEDIKNSLTKQLNKAYYTRSASGV